MTIIQYNEKKCNWYFFRILREAGNFIVLGGTNLLHNSVSCNFLADDCNFSVTCKFYVNDFYPLYVGVYCEKNTDI